MIKTIRAWELKKELTLGNIVDDTTQNHAHVFAVVLDVSNPYKKDNGQFVTRLKVIDPSFNYRTIEKVEKLKFHKFVSVFIYHEIPEDTPKIEKIGDIIRLRRFKFKISEKGALIAHSQTFSNWLVYPGYTKSKKTKPQRIISCKTMEKNQKRILNNFEEGRLRDLRDWEKNFLRSNSVIYINWWNPHLEHTKKQEGVDLLLKVLDLKKNLFHLEDGKKRKFTMKISKPNNKWKNNILVVSNVNVEQMKKNKQAITILMNSGCCFVPEYCYDF